MEKLLRKWVANKVAGDRVVRWPIAVKGSPFRGLAAFCAKHTPVTTPGVINEVDVWRVAVVRPSDRPEGPFAALAEALLQDESVVPKEEEGRGPALFKDAHGACIDFALASAWRACRLPDRLRTPAQPPLPDYARSPQARPARVARDRRLRH